MSTPAKRSPRSQKPVAVVKAAEIAPVISDPATYRLEDQVGFRLRKAHQRATEIFNDTMRQFDVTPMQFAILAKLHDLGVVSQNQLGRYVAMDPATTFGVVGRLMKRGAVHQQPDPNDARLTLIELTPEGRDLVERMKAVGADVSRRTLEPLTAAEARALVALLAKIE